MTDKPTVKVSGMPLTIAHPYAEGHTLTAPEAAALNQLRANRVAGIIRASVNEMIAEKGVEASIPEAQAMLDEAEKGYEFTIREATAADPVAAEAYRLAKAAVTAQLKKQGIKQKDYKAKYGEDAIILKAEEFAQNPKVIAAAKKAVKEREQLSEAASEVPEIE